MPLATTCLAGRKVTIEADEAFLVSIMESLCQQTSKQDVFYGSDTTDRLRAMTNYLAIWVKFGMMIFCTGVTVIMVVGIVGLVV